MALEDVDLAGSPANWFVRLSRKLQDRQKRLRPLADRLEGNPPLPEGSENMRAAYQQFQKKSRTNFAELLVQSRCERMIPAGVRIGATEDDEGNDLAHRIFTENGLDVEIPDVIESMVGLGDGYMIVGAVDDNTGVPVITAESPLAMVTIHDPAQQRVVRAGFKAFHDPDEGIDLAYVYLPGEVHVAYREAPRRRGNRTMSFAPGSWTWDEERSGDLVHNRVPVVRWRNRRGISDFERHSDLLDRIDHGVLNRMVIIAMQAFKQRAIKGELPATDDKGNPIDYEAVFTADPGALWELGADLDIWESGQTDITPVLTAVAKDIEMFSAVGKVPLSHMVPSAAPQTAEGAALAREGLVFLVEHLLARASAAEREMWVLAFLSMGRADLADSSKIEPLWLPPERRSLTERADAVSKIGDKLPLRVVRTDILQFPPAAVAQMEIDDARDALVRPPQQLALPVGT